MDAPVYVYNRFLKLSRISWTDRRSILSQCRPMTRKRKQLSPSVGPSSTARTRSKASVGSPPPSRLRTSSVDWTPWLRTHTVRTSLVSSAWSRVPTTTATSGWLPLSLRSWNTPSITSGDGRYPTRCSRSNWDPRRMRMNWKRRNFCRRWPLRRMAKGESRSASPSRL